MKGCLVAGVDVGVVGKHIEHHGTVRALIAQVADFLQVVRRPGRSREADIRLVAADGRGDVDGLAADNDAVIGERDDVGRGIPVDRDRVILAILDIAEVDRRADPAHRTIDVERGMIVRNIVIAGTIVIGIEFNRDGMSRCLDSQGRRRPPR